MAYRNAFGPIRRNSGAESPYLPNCGQINSCPFVRTLQERANQDRQMEQKAENLRSREKALQQELNRLKREKYVIHEESQRLSRQKKALEEKESQIADRQNLLNLQQLALTRQKESLEAREAQHLRDRGALQILEHQLTAREHTLDSREAQISGRENQMLEAAAEYRRERQLLEEVKASCTSGAGITDAMQEVRSAFLSIGDEFKNTQLKLRQLIGAVDRSARDGIVQLCRLHREMRFSGDPQVRLLGDRLSLILQAAFEAELLEPQAGETYDSSCHERLNITCAGSSILRSRAPGWRWKDEILMRSVVETGEKDVEV